MDLTVLKTDTIFQYGEIPRCTRNDNVAVSSRQAQRSLS